MAVLYINDLIVEARHGVHPHEKAKAQRFKISVELSTDLSLAGRSDDLVDTLNWSMLRDTIINTTQNNSFNLVERLAQEIADQLLQDKRIQKLRISIDKLDAFSSGIPGVRLDIANHQ